MTPGAEDQTRVQSQGNPPVLGDLLPLRDHHQLFAHFNGLVVFPPVVFPVAVLHIAHLDLAVGGPDLPQGVLSLRIVGEVAFDAAHAEKPVFQFLVHIVPVLVFPAAIIAKHGLLRKSSPDEKRISPEPSPRTGRFHAATCLPLPAPGRGVMKGRRGAARPALSYGSRGKRAGEIASFYSLREPVNKCTIEQGKQPSPPCQICDKRRLTVT